MKYKLWFIPLILFLVGIVPLMLQLMRNAQGDDPTHIESALLGKPLPKFTLESLQEPNKIYQFTDLLTGEPLLLNVWATWCTSCYEEHQYLNQLAGQKIRIVGLNYKDKRQEALKWLQNYGNPYQLSLFDEKGLLGLDLGVYGAPETFIVDRKGVIRFRHLGSLNEQIWQEKIASLWNEITGEEK